MFCKKVGDFMRDHPGGRALISSGIGKDATGRCIKFLYVGARTDSSHSYL